MIEVSRTAPHPIPGSRFVPGGQIPGAKGWIQGGSAQRAALPESIAKRAVEGGRSKAPSRPLERWRGSAEHPVQPMPWREVVQRLLTTSEGKLSPGFGRRAILLLRPTTKGGGAKARAGYGDLRFTRSLLDDEVSDDDRIALLTPVGDKFRDSQDLARHLWETQDPDELAELLKDALPASELGDSEHRQALFDKIKGLAHNPSKLMDWLAEVREIPRHLDLEDRKALRSETDDEIHQLESSDDPNDTREVSFFRLAHVAKKQANPLEFLSTAVKVAQKDPTTWIELLRSIVQDHSSGATSPEILKGTVGNLILAMGVEMQSMASWRLFDKKRLEMVNALLQRIYTVHKLIFDLEELRDQEWRSRKLLEKNRSIAAAAA